MREAFEQLIERQTCEHFKEWLEYREMTQKVAQSSGIMDRDMVL